MRRDDASGASAAIAGFDSEGEGHCFDSTESWFHVSRFKFRVPNTCLS
jgi:hypothetical protein